MSTYCLPQFVYGKIIANGNDISGFRVVGNTPALTEEDYHNFVTATFSGQVFGIKNLLPSYGLTEADSLGRRVLFQIEKSIVPDKRRGPFPIRRGVIVSQEVFNNFSTLQIVKEINEYKFNREYSSYETFPFLCIKTEKRTLPSNKTSDLNKYNKMLLYILDALFSSKSVLVVTKNPDPFFRIALMDIVMSLLPSSLQKQFSFNTNIYEPLNQVNFKIMFIQSKFVNFSEKVIDIDFFSNFDYKLTSPYTKYLFSLITQSKISFKELANYCKKILVDAKFDEHHSVLLYRELSKIIQNR
jgi:hypothetical protein